MTHNPALVFDVVAIVCFGVAAIPWTAPGNPDVYYHRVVALGLAFFTLAHLMG